MEIHPDDRDSIQRIFNETVTTGSGQRAEFRFVRKDGTAGIADTVVVPLSDEFGRRIAALGITKDVTDRKNLEQLKKERETS